MRIPTLLLNRNDAIWQWMKEDAGRWAESDRPLPTDEEGLERVGRIANAVLPEDVSLPVDAHRFYADEFCTMVTVKRARAFIKTVRGIVNPAISRRVYPQRRELG